MKTQILSADATAEAAVALTAGAAIALPTETVYGLAADALRVDAVMKIFEAKERPRFDPLIIHIPDQDWFERLTAIPAASRELVDALISSFWPGPLTLVLPRQLAVPDIVTAGLKTVAIRMSAHPVFDRIIQAFGRPLAAPSANRFGRISPTTALHVLAELEGRIAFIIDGGATTHGLESTIVAVRDGGIEILRPGPITAEQLAALGEVRLARARDRPEAPGQLPSHYAPRTRLVVTTDLASFILAAGARGGGLTLRQSAAEGFAELRTLSATGDLREAAANLFRHLRELDQAGLDLIVAEEISEVGLGTAIMDRLRRAAAPQP